MRTGQFTEGNKGNEGGLLRSFVFFVCFCALSLRLLAGVQITGLAISTNIPNQDFTAAGGTTAYWMASNYCWSGTFTVSGDPGTYWLQWNYALGNPRTNFFPGGHAVSGHGFLDVYPPITLTNGPVTVTMPVKPSPEGFFRLRKI